MQHRDSFTPSALVVVKRASPSSLKIPGAFVRLASGGPLGIIMTVGGDDFAHVRWLTCPPTESVLPDVCLIESSVCEGSQADRAAEQS